MAAIIQLTFDGTMVRNTHQIAMRDLAQTMMGIQAAADRACLDVLYGNVWKHQRLRRQHHELVEFIVGEPRAGSYIIDFISEQGGLIVRRMIKAISDPYAEAIAEGDQQIYTLGHQIESRRDAARETKKLIKYEDLDDSKNPLITRTYGDRSINKEFGQMLNALTREPDGLIRLVMKESDDDIAITYEFDNEIAKKFKRIISERKLSTPVIYEGIIRELDRGSNKKKNFRGKFINASNNKTITIHIEEQSDFSDLVPYLDKEEPFKIIASPIVEFESFDPIGGDIQFLRIHHD